MQISMGQDRAHKIKICTLNKFIPPVSYLIPSFQKWVRRSLQLEPRPVL